MEADLEDHEFYLKDIYHRLWRSFSFLAVPVPKPFTEWAKDKAYMTVDSMKSNLPKFMGHECEFLVTNLFRVLSDNHDLNRVYFNQYIEKLYKVLTAENYRDRMKLCFTMLDMD